MLMALNPITPAGRLAPRLFHKTRMEYQFHLCHYHRYYPNVRFLCWGFINHPLEKKSPSLRLVTSIAVFGVLCLSTFSLIFSKGSLILSCELNFSLVTSTNGPFICVCVCVCVCVYIYMYIYIYIYIYIYVIFTMSLLNDKIESVKIYKHFNLLILSCNFNNFIT